MRRRGRSASLRRVAFVLGPPLGKRSLRFPPSVRGLFLILAGQLDLALFPPLPIDLLDPALEALHFSARKLTACRQLDGSGIDLLAVHQHLVVEMRPGRCSGASNIADHISLAHPHARSDAFGESAEMGIGGLIAITVADTDVVAIAAIAPGHLHRAVTARIDRGASGGGKVDALMHAVVTLDGVPPHAEVGRDSSAIDRGSQQAAARREPIGIIEIGGAVVAFKAIVGLLPLPQPERHVVEVAAFDHRAHVVGQYSLVGLDGGSRLDGPREVDSEANGPAGLDVDAMGRLGGGTGREETRADFSLYMQLLLRQGTLDRKGGIALFLP